MNDPNALTDADWQAQQAVWEGRVRVRGAEAAPFHVRHTPEEFAALTETQGALAFAQLNRRGVVPNGTILDYGCGAGRWTRALAATYHVPTMGVDLTPSLVAYAEAHAGSAYETYRQLAADGRIPLADRSVDLLWAWTVLSAILDDRMLRVALGEWGRVLRPGGLICLVDNTSKVGGKPVRSPHSISRTVQEYQRLFRTWAPLEVVGDFVDLNEVNTIFLGTRR